MTAANPARDRAPSGLRGCRIVGAAALLLVAVAGLTPAANRLAARYAEPEQLAPSDAIVVLGGDVTPDGWLDTAGSRRLLHGILLYHRGLAPLLVVLGGIPGMGWRRPRLGSGSRERWASLRARRSPWSAPTRHGRKRSSWAPRSGRGACAPSCS